MNKPKTKNQIIFGACIAFLTMAAYFSCHTDSVSLPGDLMYNGKPITNSQMWEIVPLITLQRNNGEIDLTIPLDDGLGQEDRYEWSYIGTLPHGDHLVYAYWSPSDGMGKFTEIALVRRIGNMLKTISQIEGGDRHATMIVKDAWKLETNVLTYHQCMTTGLLYTILLETLPEHEQQKIEKRNTERLYWGEADYRGYATMQATFNKNGTIKETILLSFTPAEGVEFTSSQKEKEYWESWKKQTAKNSLAMGDALLGALELYRYKNNTETLDLSQLQEILLEACTYAKKQPENE